MFGLRTAPMVAAAFLFASMLFTAAPDAAAGVVVDGTRVVYPEDRHEVTIRIHNPGDAPSLVQAWLDAGDPNAKPGESKVPFVMTPPLFRLDPAKSQSLRLMYTHDPLPRNSESLFWLNVLDIPPRAPASADRPNRLELAFKHRMKVFFRPAGLRGTAADAPAHLEWTLLLKDGKLVGVKASNPTAYHVSLVQVAAKVDGHPIAAKADMVDPFASRTFALPGALTVARGAVPLEYSYINDYGGAVSGTASASAP